jgi:hypothetical protein
MNGSDKDSAKPLNTTAASDESTKAPADSSSDSSIDPKTQEWIHRLAEGMRVMATNEEERRKIAKRLF